MVVICFANYLSLRFRVKVRFVVLPLRRAFGTVARLKERMVPVPIQNPQSFFQTASGWPSFGSRPLRLSGGGTSATYARKAPDPHKLFLCVRFARFGQLVPRLEAESSHKNPLCLFGGGGSNPAFLACGADGLGAARSSHAPPQREVPSGTRECGLSPSASLFRRRVSFRSAGVCVVVRPLWPHIPRPPGALRLVTAVSAAQPRHRALRFLTPR